MPSKEVGVPRRPVGLSESRTADVGEPGMPGSSGLDFIDLVGMDDSTVWNRLQDAVTYRVLVGHHHPDSPHASGHTMCTKSPTFNIKQLKLYRDNVTRNLAPTVARGFANAARAAGHVIHHSPQPTATAAPAQLNRVQQPANQAQSAAPLQPQPQPQQHREQGLATAQAANGRASAASHVAAAAAFAAAAATTTGAAASSAAEGSQSELPRRQQAPRQPPTPTPATAAAAPADAAMSSVVIFRSTRRMSLSARSLGEHHRMADTGSGTQGVRQEGCPSLSEDTAATAAFHVGPTEPPPSTASASSASSGAVTLVVAGAGAATASALALGRRRGSRGAGRGPLLAAAGRQAGGAGAAVSAGAGPAWI